MNAFFFGTRHRQLFGIYEPARARNARTRAVVICHPWGQEYLRAHRSLRQLATMLNAAGFDTLRFDYFGTGDSAGEMTGATLEGWQGDIEAAIEEMKYASSAARVELVGLRLGATLAATVTTRRPRDVDALVMWDPVVSGAEYLQELHHTASIVMGGGQPAARPAGAGGGHEILGFPLTAAMARELKGIDLQALVANLPARTLVLASQPLASHARLSSALAGHVGAPLLIESLASPLAWIEDRHTGAGAIPIKVLQRIVQWSQ